MHKYRQHVQQLKLMEEKEKMAVHLFNTGLAQEIQEKTSKIQEMASIMQHAIDIDDTNNASQEERINALLLENRGLKEILAVHENMRQHKQIPEPTTESSVAQSTSEITTMISSSSQQEASS